MKRNNSKIVVAAVIVAAIAVVIAAWCAGRASMLEEKGNSQTAEISQNASSETKAPQATEKGKSKKSKKSKDKAVDPTVPQENQQSESEPESEKDVDKKPHPKKEEVEYSKKTKDGFRYTLRPVEKATDKSAFVRITEWDPYDRSLPSFETMRTSVKLEKDKHYLLAVLCSLDIIPIDDDGEEYKCMANFSCTSPTSVKGGAEEEVNIALAAQGGVANGAAKIEAAGDADIQFSMEPTVFGDDEDCLYAIMASRDDKIAPIKGELFGGDAIFERMLTLTKLSLNTGEDSILFIPFVTK